jgi:uncharacterized small protein (DUF1192 family)
MLFDEEEPAKKPKKPKPLDDLSVGDLEAYIAALESEIERVKTALKAKQLYAESVAGLFKS